MNWNSENDLAKILTNEINIDLRNLSPNVVRAWLDTDCEDTKNLLKWMGIHLSSSNFVSPMEQAEFNEINEPLDLNKCSTELQQLQPLLCVEADTSEDLLLSELEALENENQKLKLLIECNEDMINNLALDVTQHKQKEIKAVEECKKAYQVCEGLCGNLDKLNGELEAKLKKFNPDANFANFVDIEDFKIGPNKFNYLNSILEMDKTVVEDLELDDLPEELNICRKRLLHSHQIYVCNKVEIKANKEVLTNYLRKLDLTTNNDWISTSTANKDSNISLKESYRKSLCEVLDSNAAKFSDNCLTQYKFQYIKSRLEDFEKYKEHLCHLSDRILAPYIAYILLINGLLVEEKKDVELSSKIFQNTELYVNRDLFKCQRRINYMKNVIENHKLYLQGNGNMLSKLIGNVLSPEDSSLKSLLEAALKFRREMDLLENNFFSTRFSKVEEKLALIKQDINTLNKFLVSGPSERLVVVPTELSYVLWELEKHFKNESDVIAQAIQIPKNVRKSMTDAQNFLKQLWMYFLISPEKVQTVLRQAEDNFNERTAKYF